MGEHLTAQDYSEILFEAVSSLIRTSLEGLPYDITKQCTIVNADNAADGLYIVSDGSVKFEAYSDVKDYRKGTVVYVTIPNGDFNMQKNITGKQVGTNTSPFTFTAPLDTLIELGSDSYCSTPYSILANGTTKVKNIKITKNLGYQGFTRLGVSADFRSWLAPMETVNGTYGIKIFLTCESTSTTEGDNVQKKTFLRELTLSSNDMYGNPYGFETYFSQEKIFDISNIETITDIQVVLFQDGSFKNTEGELIPATDELTNTPIPDNIFVNNIKIYFGYDQKDFTDDDLALYTRSGETYNNVVGDENRKDISLRWIHKVLEDDKFRIVEEKELGDTLTVKWYRYVLGAPAADSYSGAYWTELSSYVNKLNCSIIPDVTLGSESIKAIAFVKHTSESEKEDGTIEIKESFTPYYSEAITFDNQSPVIDEMTVQAIQGLSIVCLDSSEGNYFLYDQNGKILDSGNGSVHTRKMQLFFDGGALKSGLNLTGITEVIWYLPVQDTSMIVLFDKYYSRAKLPSGASTPEMIDKEGKKYRRIRYIPNKSNSLDTEDNLNNFAQEYAIRDNWSPDYSDNTVICEVKVDNRTYTAKHEFMFGKAGTTGTDTTLVLNIENNENAIYYENGDSYIEVAAYLYDSTGKIIDPSEYQESLKWNWKNNGIAGTNYQFLNIAKNEGTNRAKITFSKKPDNSLLKANFHLLEATIEKWGNWDDGQYDLVSYLPIPVKTSKDYAYITGTREVVYNTQGTPDYHSDVYSLWKYTSEEYTSVSCKWGLTYSLTNDSTGKAFAPTLKETKQGPQFRASVFYLKDANDNICVCATDSNGTVLWSQPVLVIQNQYAMSMLNQWDGSLTIDKENGTILSTMLGAGRKNSNNTFSGILIGDVKKGTGTNAGTSGSKIGVYGYQEGLNTFALLEDGTATFGVNGSGQIRIDGTSGTIESGNYSENGRGMSIDLNAGSIHIQDDYRDRIILKPTSPYFKINSSDRNTLILMGNNEYYLQSNDFVNAIGNEENWTGSKLDLTDGTFETLSSYGMVRLTNGKSKNNIERPYFQVTAAVTLENNERSDVELIHMGQSNYYLQSKNYSALKIKRLPTNNEYYVYRNASNIQIAVPVSGSGNIYLINTTDNSLGSVINPPTEKEVIISWTDVNGNVQSTKEIVKINDPRGEYLSTLTPVIEKDSDKGSGMYIDLNNGLISGYDLFLRGIKRKNNPGDPDQTIVFNSGDPTTPLSIGSDFRVNWDGTLNCAKVNYLGTQPNTGEYIININDNFKVTSGGGVSGTTGNFGGGWFGGTSAKVSVKGGGGSSTSIAGIDSNGYIYNTGRNVAELANTINSLVSSVESLKSAISNHKHSISLSSNSAFIKDGSVTITPSIANDGKSHGHTATFKGTPYTIYLPYSTYATTMYTGGGVEVPDIPIPPNVSIN